tara:strand:+ start:191 stop:901 length:711 start_codon:yes stop_codon:yes gene_type:complete
MASTVIKNWDNKTWLASKDYINAFNKFLLKHTKLDLNSKVLDVGCGRGKILGNLSSKLKLINKPIGIDIIHHKDKDVRINFKKVNALSFFFKNREKFDLIIIKQTIHLLKFSEIKKLLILSKKKLNPKGKIFIFFLDIDRNEIPVFKLMKKKLINSLKRDKKIMNIISKLHPYAKKKNFMFKVRMTKKKYLKMIKNKYISVLLNISNKDLLKGLDELNTKYKKNIKFNDKLICLIL